MKYILFGAGILGERYYDLLKDDYNIICFADNDPNKQGGKLISLDIISPGKIKEYGLNVIITSSYHTEIAKQLFEMGIKTFYVPVNNEEHSLALIDLSPYNDLAEKNNKICVMRRRDTGVISSALIKNNPFPDIEISSVNTAKRDSLYYYNYLTSSLIITQYGEETGNKKSIELWHGFTIKTIGFMSNDTLDKEFAQELKAIINKKDAICSLSKLYSVFTSCCFDIPYQKFSITGYPRNDMLFSSNSRELIQKLFGKVDQKRIVIYLPTYRINDYNSRKNGECSYIFNMPGFNEADFDNFLRDNDIVFIHKSHSSDAAEQNICETDSIRTLTDAMLDEHEMDLFEILNGTDCLISDYSSVIIDYLLTGKPMIFTPTDLDAYSETRGLMMEPYDAWMPGEIAVTYVQLKSAISNVFSGEDVHAKDRNRLKRITHKYTDGKSTQRVLSLAREILGLK